MARTTFVDTKTVIEAAFLNDLQEQVAGVTPKSIELNGTDTAYARVLTTTLNSDGHISTYGWYDEIPTLMYSGHVGSGSNTFGSGSFYVGGTVYLADTLRAIGNVDFDGDLTVDGDTVVEGSASIGATSIDANYSLNVADKLRVASDLDVTGSSTYLARTLRTFVNSSGIATTGGYIDSNYKLICTQDLSSGDVAFEDGAFSIGGTLAVAENVAFDKDLVVAGQASVGSAFVDAAYELKVDGNLRVADQLDITGSDVLQDRTFTIKTSTAGLAQMVGYFDQTSQQICHMSTETGDVEFFSDVDIVGDVSTEGTVFLNGTSVYKERTVTEGVSDSGTYSMYGYFDQVPTLIMTAHVGSGNVYFGSGNFMVDGAVTLNSTLDVTGDATLDSTLDVTGDATLDSTLDVTGDVSTEGTVFLNGTSVYKERTVTEGVSDSGNYSMYGYFNQVPTLIMTAHAGSGDVHFGSGSFTVDGAVTLNSTLDVTGDATLDSTLDVTGDVHFGSGSFMVDGAADLNSTLNVDGIATLKSRTYSENYYTISQLGATSNFKDVVCTSYLKSMVDITSSDWYHIEVAGGASWVPAAGIWSFVSNADDLHLSIYAGGTWRWRTQVELSGTIIFDGINMRVQNSDPTNARGLYYLKQGLRRS